MEYLTKLCQSYRLYRAEWQADYEGQIWKDIEVNIHVMLLENTSVPPFSYRQSEIVYLYNMEMLNHTHIQFLFIWLGVQKT
jgi:hypothetical protein